MPAGSNEDPAQPKKKKNLTLIAFEFANTFYFKNDIFGNSLVLQWLGLRAFTAVGTSAIPGQGTKIPQAGASLVAQWLRICLPMQGTQVQGLVREDPTCRGATKAVHHNY